MSTNILMIGDSWGVPFYNHLMNLRPKDHTEFRLKDLGYKVFNFSLNGGSMIDTIEYARYVLEKQDLNKSPFIVNHILPKRNTYANGKGECDIIPIPNYQGEKIDFIIWFYTEALRDWKNDTIGKHCSIKDVHDFCTLCATKYFLNLLNLFPDAKTCVIGGQAPVDDIFLQHHTPDFLIQDWRGKIVNKLLPKIYCISRHDFLGNSNDDTSVKLEMLNNHKIILDSMLDPNLFPDNCHPGSIPHEQLTNELHSFFQQNVNTGRSSRPKKFW